MVDFHTHILPKLDDGSDSVRKSLTMLRRSFLQGVSAVVLTPHFYADEEYPRDFLLRRKESFQKLQYAMLMSPSVYPEVVLGAEVLYFPGISEAEAVGSMMVGDSKTILIEPPMISWTEEMLDEISRIGENFHCTPVIAHVDRYMWHLQDQTLIQRVRERDLLVQVNTEYFLNPKTARAAVKYLKSGNIQFVGSDCHDLHYRPPNMVLLKKQAKAMGAEWELKKLFANAKAMLLGGV